ncbi:MAG TPA: hypothetical protein VFU36_06515 [Jatrophihabitans sp.]|nr:hypothetical protein [Jatrophihabitans sp.]
MSIDARSYADSAVAQGRSALAHAGTALGQAGIALGAVNRRLLAEAPKPVYAALGAADLVTASLTKRAEELPADAATGLDKAQHTGQALIARAQDEAVSRMGEASDRLDDLRGRLAAGRQTVATLPGTARVAGAGYLSAAKSAREGYLQAAKGVYALLTDRGETRAAELRKNPRVAKLLGQLNGAAEEVRETVAPVAKSAFDAVTEPADTEPTVAELPKPASRVNGNRTGTGPAASSKPAASKTSASKPAAKKAAAAKTSKA